jgi:hypothetical protein
VHTPAVSAAASLSTVIAGLLCPRDQLIAGSAHISCDADCNKGAQGVDTPCAVHHPCSLSLSGLLLRRCLCLVRARHGACCPAMPALLIKSIHTLRCASPVLPVPLWPAAETSFVPGSCTARCMLPSYACAVDQRDQITPLLLPCCSCTSSQHSEHRTSRLLCIH